MADLNLETQMKNSSLNGDLSEAEIAKEKGNEAFKNQRFGEAVDHYTEAIRLKPNEASYYGNRSFAYIKSEFYGSALQDANRSIELDSKYLKGYYRRASAYLALGKFKQALKDYECVTKVRPNDKDAQLKYNECLKIVKRIAFEKAIAVDDVKNSVFDDLDIQAIPIESDYKGPKFDFTQDSHAITHEFALELIEHFKAQKVLHKKFAYKILFEINKLLKSLPSLIDIKFDEKFTVCGDVHGQFYDLLNIFKLNGMPSLTNPYLFNGDFVDRGSFSLEVIFTLFTFKLLYPNHFFMARGNHESITMNQMYGFEGEVKAKY